MDVQIHDAAAAILGQASTAGPASTAGDARQYVIAQVPVQFPFAAYGSQVSLMAAGIRALSKGQNALLESPTGSGKSLALLCCCLGWQVYLFGILSPPCLPPTTRPLPPSSIHAAHTCTYIYASSLFINPTASQRYEQARLRSQFRLQQEADAARREMDDALAAAAAAAAVRQAADTAAGEAGGDGFPAASSRKRKLKPKSGSHYTKRNNSEGSGDNSTARRTSHAAEAMPPEHSDSEDDFQQPTPRRRTPPVDRRHAYHDGSPSQQVLETQQGAEGQTIGRSIPISTPADTKAAVPKLRTGPKPAASKPPRKTPKAPTAPKIFFGTRTHRQISQIVAELRRTAYADSQMTILSSREVSWCCGQGQTHRQ